MVAPPLLPWPRLVPFVLASLFALVLLGAGCPEGKVRRDAPPDRPPVTFRMVVLTDLLGTLEPCGCTSRPLGGIDKLAAHVGELRRDGAPLLLLAAGDLFFPTNPVHDAEGAKTQELWKAETLVDVLGRLKADAVTPGPGDLRFGAEPYRALAERARFPFLDGASCEEAPTVLVREIGGVRVGMFGVTRAGTEACPSPPDLRAQSIRGRDALVAAGADVRIALVAGERRDARNVAVLEGIDFVVLGGLAEAEPTPPSRTGAATVLTAGRQGAGLLVVDVWTRTPRKPYVDVGAFRSEVERKRRAEAVSELEARIAAWEKDPSIPPSDIEAQRARLVELRREASRQETPSTLPKGNVIASRYVELPAEAPSNPQIRAVMTAYDRRVNEHNRRAFADLRPAPAAEGEASYVGSKTCAACHTRAYAWWTTTPHGNAYATLQKRHKEFNLSCVGCHVTGYEKPGGSTVAHVKGFENVGCESCHGPGSRHVENPRDAQAPLVRDTPASVCVGCHNEEHSDLFEYDAYRRMLLVPGHGLPAEGGS